MLFSRPGRSLAWEGLVTEDLAEGRHCLDSALQCFSVRGWGQGGQSGSSIEKSENISVLRSL